MSMLDFWFVLLLAVVLVGIIGRRRFGDRAKLWLWRAGFLVMLIVAAGQQQERECRIARLSYQDCRHAPIRGADLVEWIAMAVFL
jgi:hypothetical protein